jgi:hypothetical protein
MTRDEIIEMAIQAGFDWSGKHLTWEFAMCDEEIEAFAKLVAQHERERLTDAAMKAAEKGIDTAIALEREACSSIASDYAQRLNSMTAVNIADAIRARGQA